VLLTKDFLDTISVFRYLTQGENPMLRVISRTVDYNTLLLLEKKIQLLNKLCKKFNVSPITIKTIETNTDALGKVSSQIEMTVPDMSNLVNPGFEVLGIVENAISDKDASLLDGRTVKTVAFGKDLTNYFTREIKCDHCNINRFRKQYVIILDKITNQTYTVGGDCLTNYVPGGANSIDFLENISYIYEEQIKEDESYESEYFKSKLYYNVKTLLWMTWVWLTNNPYLKADSEEVSTKSALNCLYCHICFNKKTKFSKNLVEDFNMDMYIQGDSKIVEDLISYVMSKQIRSEYDMNLKSYISQKEIDFKGLGYVVSVIPSYRNMQEKITKQKLLKPKGESEYIGTIKEKITIPCMYVGLKVIDTRFGTSYLYKFIANEKDEIAWFASKKQPPIPQDKPVLLKGIVKDHKDEYMGIKQTLMKNCKITWEKTEGV